MKKQKKLLVTTPKKGEIGKSVKLSKKERKVVKEIVERDVHTEHCCLKHGCKYGYELLGKADQCSVVSGKKKQSYDCEECEYDKQEIENYKLCYTPATAKELIESFNLTKEDKIAIKRAVDSTMNKKEKSACKHINRKVIVEGKWETTSSSGYCIESRIEWCKACGGLLKNKSEWTLPTGLKNK